MNLPEIVQTPEQLQSSIAIVVAIFSLVVAIMVGIKQNQTFLLNFMTEQARQVNSFLEKYKLPSDPGAASGLISTFVSTQEALSELKTRFRVAYLLLHRRLLRIFFLQLHTSVRLWLKGNGVYGDDYLRRHFQGEYLDTIRKQIKTAREFMEAPMKKY